MFTGMNGRAGQGDYPSVIVDDLYIHGPR
jgi:hypothetical protein